MLHYSKNRVADNNRVCGKAICFDVNFFKPVINKPKEQTSGRRNISFKVCWTKCFAIFALSKKIGLFLFPDFNPEKGCS